jgi:hypothetical protein
MQRDKSTTPAIKIFTDIDEYDKAILLAQLIMQFNRRNQRLSIRPMVNQGLMP